MQQNDSPQEPRKSASNGIRTWEKVLALLLAQDLAQENRHSTWQPCFRYRCWYWDWHSHWCSAPAARPSRKITL